MKMLRNFFYFSLVSLCVILLVSCDKSDSEPACKDADGNVYTTIKIGNQEWMAENLRTTKYRNGDAIPNITADAQWITQTAGAYCVPKNEAANKAIYGCLYNWATITDSRKIAPEGWHIPTKTEWEQLVNFLGGDSIAGSKMKETGTTYWTAPNSDATNSSGFNARGAGYRSYETGEFENFGDNAYWWSTTTDDTDPLDAYRCKLYNDEKGVSIKASSKVYGMAIRCVKD